MQAARQDKYADNSIGNVTGSNAVNVFLGLGLPWLIGSLYWELVGANSAFDDKFKPGRGTSPMTAELWAKYGETGKGAFYVSKKGLGLSVLVFIGCAAGTLGIILLRRFALNPPAELG